MMASTPPESEKLAMLRNCDSRRGLLMLPLRITPIFPTAIKVAPDDN